MQSLLNEKLGRVAVVGACGKMGRGIALLILQEMVLIALKAKQGRSFFHLDLIDPYEEGYYDLKLYLEQQLTRFAEKNINALRELYQEQEDLTSNGEIVSSFVSEAMRFVNCSSEIGTVKKGSVIFEAAFEKIPLKVDILRKIREHAPHAWVLSNTSSIPIGLLAKESGLGNKLIGCHFYNPPPVQKLIELIPSEEGEEGLTAFAVELAKRLKKTVVFSKDVAGFIGNGHFSREIVFACELVAELSQNHSKEAALQIVDTVTRDFLLRPMGIFQLLDYVGVPIAEHILHIISKYVPDPSVKAPLIKELIDAGLKGGQTLEGHPKDGIFYYIQGKVDGIYSFGKKGYEPLGDLSFLGQVPDQLSWKKLHKEKHLSLSGYFEKLFSSKEQGCLLAARFLKRSFEIESLLVDTGVAATMKEVSTVLKNGFHHIYTPDEVVK